MVQEFSGGEKLMLSLKFFQNTTLETTTYFRKIVFRGISLPVSSADNNEAFYDNKKKCG